MQFAGRARGPTRRFRNVLNARGRRGVRRHRAHAFDRSMERDDVSSASHAPRCEEWLFSGSFKAARTGVARETTSPTIIGPDL
jgi:hypothetical protein